MNPEQLATTMEPGFRRAFMRALAAAKVKALRLGPIQSALDTGSPADVMAAIPWEHFENELSDRLTPLILSTVQRGIRHGAEAAVRKDRVGVIIDFAIQNPDAIAWARRHAGELVLGLSQQSKDAVREIVAQVTAGQISREDAAKRIRNVVGLTPVQSKQLTVYESVIRQHIAEPKAIATRVDTYRQRLLAGRAELIARTETMQAANDGQHKAWQSMKAQGYLDDDARREFLVTPDERLCSLCSPIPDNGPVGLEEPFIAGDGQAHLNPPIHPACRCSVALVFLNDR